VLVWLAGPVNLVQAPASAVDDLANTVKAAAVDLTAKVLTGLHEVGHFDPASAWFRDQYAAAAGIGLVVMAVSAILTIARSASGQAGRWDLREALLTYLPLGAFLLVFSPAIGALLAQAADGLATGLDRWAGGHLADANRKLAALGAVTADQLPGGVFVGLLAFLLMVIGAFCVFAGLLVQQVGLPITGVVAAVAWGMFVNPRTRRVALRVPLTWIGLLLAKPVLYLVLGVVFALIDNSVRGDRVVGIPLLAELVLVSVALIAAGIAPFLLLRYGPSLLTHDRPHRTNEIVVGTEVEHVVRVEPGGTPLATGTRAIERAYEQARQDHRAPVAAATGEEE